MFRRIAILAFALLMTVGPVSTQLQAGVGLPRVFVLPLLLGVTGTTSETLPYGASANIYPVFTYGTGVVTDALSNVIASNVTSGNAYHVGPLVASQVYTLTITNSAGDLVTGSATVTITAPVLAAVAPATANVTTGLTQGFSSSVTGAVNTTVNWSVDGISGGNAAVGTISGAGLYTAGSTAGAHTITAMAAANGATQTSAATVYAAPSVTTFSASTTSPLYGATVTLTPTFTGGTGSVSNGIGAVTTGTGYPTAAITSTQNYVLTVTNVPGQIATSGTVTVIPQTVVVASVSPATVNLTTAFTQTFSSSVTGASNTTVNWSVDGISGGSAAVGTISGAGLYTAGTSAGAHTIKATAAANGTTNQTATATVYAAPSVTTFSASTTSPLYGATVTLTPTFTGGTGSVSNGIGAVTTGTGYPTAAITSTQNYVLTVTNVPGQIATSGTVTVIPQTVTVQPISPAGVTRSVNTVTSFSTSVTGGALGTVTWSASAGAMTPGTGAWTAPATAQTVTITATSNDQGSKTATTTVTVVALPTISSFSAGTTTITAGNGTFLNYSWSGSSAVIGTSGAGSTQTSGGVSGSSLAISPGSTTTYTMTAYNAAGASTTATASVTVDAAPVITGFLASPSTINSGSASTLSWSTTGAVSASISPTVGGVAVNSSTSVSPTSTTTYTLTATNGAGTNTTATTTVTVNSGPVCSGEVDTQVAHGATGCGCFGTNYFEQFGFNGTCSSWKLYLEGSSTASGSGGAVNGFYNTSIIWADWSDAAGDCSASSTYGDSAVLALTYNGTTLDFDFPGEFIAGDGACGH